MNNQVSWLTEERLAELDSLPYESRRLLALRIWREGREEISQLRKACDDARKEGNHDGLTGVANWRSFNMALPEAEESDDWMVVLFDGNNFGEINKYGPAGMKQGDEAIKRAANCIRQAAADFGIARRVFRVGGDEFVVLAPSVFATFILQNAVRSFKVHLFPDFVVSLSGGYGFTFREADDMMRQRKAADKLQQAKLRRCSFPCCWQKHHAKGLCRGHYTQLREGKELAGLAQRLPFS